MEIPSWIECLKAYAEQRPPMPRATKARLTAGHVGALYELRRQGYKGTTLGDARGEGKQGSGRGGALPCFFRKAPAAPAPPSACDDIAALEYEQDEERKMASVRAHLRAKARARFLQRRENWVLDAKDLSQVEGALATCVMPPPPPCPRTPPISPRPSVVEPRSSGGGDDASDSLGGAEGAAVGSSRYPQGDDSGGVQGVAQQASPRGETDTQDGEGNERGGEVPRSFASSLEQFVATERFGGTADYMDFVRIRGLVNGKAGDYFSARNFLRFPRDIRGRISCHIFFKYVCDSVSLFKTKITLHFFDSRGLGHLTEHDLEHFVYDHIPTIGALQGIHEQFHTFYVISAVRRFMFFLDPKRTGKIGIDTMVRSRVMKEFIELRMAGGFIAGPVGTNGNSIKQAAQAAPAGYFEAADGAMPGGADATEDNNEEERSPGAVEGSMAPAEQGMMLPPPTLRAPSPPLEPSQSPRHAESIASEGGGNDGCGRPGDGADVAGVFLGEAATDDAARAEPMGMRAGGVLTQWCVDSGDGSRESSADGGRVNSRRKAETEEESSSVVEVRVNGMADGGDVQGNDKSHGNESWDTARKEDRALDERRLQELEEAQWASGAEDKDQVHLGHQTWELERRSPNAESHRAADACADTTGAGSGDPQRRQGEAEEEEVVGEERLEEEQWAGGRSLPAVDVGRTNDGGFEYEGAEPPPERRESNDYSEAVSPPIEPPAQPLIPVLAKDLSKNWFSAENISRVYTEYLELDTDENGLLSKAELLHFGARARTRLTPIFIERLFQEVLTYRVPASASSSSSHAPGLDHRDPCDSVPSAGIGSDEPTGRGSLDARLQSQLRVVEDLAKRDAGVQDRRLCGERDQPLEPAPNSPPRSPPMTPCPGFPTRNRDVTEGGGGTVASPPGIRESSPGHPSVGLAVGPNGATGSSVDLHGAREAVGVEQGGIQPEVSGSEGGVLARRGKGQGEMDYKSFLDLVLATENRQTRQAMLYLWRVLDANGTGRMTPATINIFYRNVVTKLREGGCEAPSVEDVKDEIFDMVKPRDPGFITFTDLVNSGNGPTVMSILTDANSFWAYDNRESLKYDVEEDPVTANNSVYGLNFPTPPLSPAPAPVPTSVAVPLGSAAHTSAAAGISDQPTPDPRSGDFEIYASDAESQRGTTACSLAQSVDLTPASGLARPLTPDNGLAPSSMSAMADMQSCLDAPAVGDGSATVEAQFRWSEGDKALPDDGRCLPREHLGDPSVDSPVRIPAASALSPLSPTIDGLKDSEEARALYLLDVAASRLEEVASPDGMGGSSPGGHGDISSGAAARAAAARAVTVAVVEHARRVSPVPVLPGVMRDAHLHRDPDLSSGDAILAANVEVSI